MGAIVDVGLPTGKRHRARHKGSPTCPIAQDGTTDPWPGVHHLPDPDRARRNLAPGSRARRPGPSLARRDHPLPEARPIVRNRPSVDPRIVAVVAIVVAIGAISLEVVYVVGRFVLDTFHQFG